MEIRQLQYFICAAKHLNFTKAAEECCIVQSAMTQQIAALERELGVRLFESKRKAMRLTEAGEALYQDAQGLAQGMERTIEKVRGISKGYAQTLRIGYHGNTMYTDLPGILARFRTQYPEVKVRLREEKVLDAIEALKKESIDCMFLPLLTDLTLEDEIERCFLKPIRIKLVVSAHHPLAERKGVRLKELEQEQFLFFDAKELKDGLHEMAMENFVPQIYDRVDCHDSMMALVEGGYAVALDLETACPKENPNLRFLDIVENVPKEKQLCLAWKKGSTRMRPEYLAVIRSYYGLSEEKAR